MLEVVVKFVLHMVINLHVNYVGSMAMLLLVVGNMFDETFASMHAQSNLSKI